MRSTFEVAPLLMSRSNSFIFSKSNGNIFSRNRLTNGLLVVEKTKSGIPGMLSC